jgi:hypothetical protein
MKQTQLLALAMSTAFAAHTQSYAAPTFADDLAFLQKHTEVVTLTDKAGAAQVAVVPAWQGRIMTSSADGPGGLSFGWVNRDLIASGKFQPHINVFGGEDRFWLGPEGGQFSIFFAKGAPFDLEHWFTPAAIDTEPFSVVSKGTDRVHFRKDLGLTNYSGTTFSLQVDREVRLLKAADVLKSFGIKTPSGLKSVAFESVNAVKNTGPAAWQKDTGLLSIWMLGMFNAAPATTIVVPFKPGPEAMLGPVVNDTYFGKVPADRLVVLDGVLYFAADANHRSKIGIPPHRAKAVLGSYDAANQVLTLVTFTVVPGATDFVNSMWELQKKPFGGDVVNSYNDGPSQPGGTQLGKFYELESSSPALALKPGQTATHRHLTIHFTGPEAKLNLLAKVVLGVSLEDIKTALKK